MRQMVHDFYALGHGDPILFPVPMGRVQEDLLDAVVSHFQQIYLKLRKKMSSSSALLVVLMSVSQFS